ncbi:PAS domain S-box protein [Picosynechococcus sp. NKBG15041c]|uniref:PAS domain S-box protein n=1 Tax=Picosynechococcus sp. NKBG15041c TaxID=1407650 RepID=UPI0004021C1C|nr:PAS domain S-box protein [Picosynechococcus sp. NKBG15041c]
MFQNSSRSPATVTDPSLLKQQNLRTKYLLGGLAIAILAVFGGGIFSFHWFSEKFLENLQNNLSAVAELQALQIDQWLQERAGDARVVAARPVVLNGLKTFESPSSTEAEINDYEARLSKLVTDLQGNYRYRRIIFFNRRGQMVWQNGQQDEPLPKRLPIAFWDYGRFAGVGGDVQIIDLELLTLGDQKRPVFGVLSHIYDENNMLVGAVYLEKDPSDFLYGLLARKSEAYTTAETILVRREGDIIRYLNPLRLGQIPPLEFTRPLNREDLLASQAILREEGLVRGIDYRQVQTVGASFGTIPEIPWIVIHKVDLREANAPIRQLAIAIGGLSGLLIIAVVGVGYQMLRLNQGQVEAIAQTAEIDRARIIADNASYYRTVMETAIDGYAVLDDQGTFVEANVALEEMTGYSLAELQQRRIFDLIIADDINPQQCLQEWGDRQRLKFIQQWRHHNGQIIDIQLSLTFFTQGQRQFFLFAQDITQQKQANAALIESERRLYHAIHDAPFPIILYASDGEVFQLNRAWTDQTGYDADEIPTIAAWAKKAYGEDHLSNLDRIKKVYDIEKPTHDGEYCLTIKSGEQRTWDFSGSPLGQLPDGRKLLVTMAIDVTERKANEIALRSAKKQAEEANRAKSLFLANMSHELRTPLNGILGYVQILKFDDSLNPDQQNSLSIIEQCGHHLLGLITDVLDFSKIEAQRVELVPSTVQFHYFLLDILQICQIKAKEKDLLLNYDIDPNLPNYFLFDEQRLRQVLLNLLGNAIKFTQKGSVILEVKCQTTQGDTLPLDSVAQHLHTVQFRIRDTGCGIEPEDLKKIFLPFEQVGDYRSRPQGTGLGLAISQKLVAMMGGQLQVTSQADQGSCFFFALDLPEVSVSAPVTSPEDLFHCHLEIVGYVGRRQMILVVDNRWVNRAVIKHFLMPLGFIVLEADNGQEGIMTAEANPVDLIISDIMMPVMNGLDMVRQIRQLDHLKVMPLVAMSADALNNNTDVFAAGFDVFLEKPLDFSLLLDTLQAQLHLTWVYEDRA